jgi:hypothetical protein
MTMSVTWSPTAAIKAKMMQQQRTYKVTISLPSIIAIIVLACTTSFLVGRNQSMMTLCPALTTLLASSSPRPSRPPPFLEKQASLNDGERMKRKSHEEVILHPVLLAHPDPKAVAVVSNSPFGILQEMLKHKTLEVLYVVVDDLSKTDKEETCIASDERFESKQQCSQVLDNTQNTTTPKIEWIQSDELQTMNLTLDIVILDE